MYVFMIYEYASHIEIVHILDQAHEIVHGLDQEHEIIHVLN